VAVAGFNQLLETMAQMDFFTGVLPFVLTYVVLYAALREIPVIGKDSGLDKNFPALIAIIGAFFVARFIVVNPYYQSFFVDYFGRLVIGLIGFFGLLILLAFTGYEIENSNIPMLMLLMISIAGAAFTTAGGFGPPWNVGMLANYDIAGMFGFLLESGLIWIGVVFGALWWVSTDSGSSGGSADTAKNFMQWMISDQSDGNGDSH
jgi:hypothetical protein